MESPYAVMAAWFCRRHSITVADTETANMVHRITGPLSTTVLTPQCFKKTISKNQLSFNGYKELAYLHPAIFCPDSAVLKKHGLSMDRPYAVIRLVAFRAMHDKVHIPVISDTKSR